MKAAPASTVSKVSPAAAVLLAACAGAIGLLLDTAASAAGWEYPSLGASAALASWGVATFLLLVWAVRRYSGSLTTTALGLAHGHPREVLLRRGPTACAILACGAALTAAVNKFGLGGSPADPQSYGGVNRLSILVLVVELLVRYPITVFAEETLFRGWLQPRLPAGILLSSLLWAGFHLQQIPTIPALIPFGIALGGIRWWTGDIRATLAIHYVGNAIFLIAAYG